MIDFEAKTITVPSASQLNGNQIYHMIDAEIAKHIVDGALPEGKEHPYEVQTVKLGERTGEEPINVGLSNVLLQRVQLRQAWEIVLSEPKEA